MGAVSLLSLLLFSFLLPLIISHSHHNNEIHDKPVKCGKHSVKLTSTSKLKYGIDQVGCWIHIWRNSEEDNYVMNDARVRAITDKEFKKMDENKLCEISKDTNHIYYTSITYEETTIDEILRICEKRFMRDWWMTALFSFGICCIISLPCLISYSIVQVCRITKEKKVRTTPVKETKRIDVTIGSSAEQAAHSNPKSAGSSNK